MKKRILCAAICLLMLLSLIPAAALSAEATGSNAAVADARKGVARVFAIGQNGDPWIGSAFGIGKVGEPTNYFITNRHCVLGEDEYGRTAVAKRIYLAVDGNSYSIDITGYVNYEGKLKATETVVDADTERMIPCDVVYYSEDYDIAILKASRVVEERVALELADSSDNAVPTDTVYSMGYPSIGDEAVDLSNWQYTGKYVYNEYGKCDIYTRSMTSNSYLEDMTITTGTVSRLAVMESENRTKVIQHDAQIHGGNSGGPLVNTQGQVIGINTYSYADQASLNYAVYIDYVRDALEEQGIEYNIKPVAPSQPAPTSPAPTQPTEEPEPETNLIPIIAIAVAVIAAAAVALVLVSNKKKKEAAQKQATAAQAAAHAVIRKAYVRSMAPQHGGMRIALQNKPILIGRSKNDCAITYAENTPGVSGRHCSILFDGNTFVLTDLKSSYGTFLQNGQKLTPGTPYPLQPGTTFWLGDKQNVLRVELE